MTRRTKRVLVYNYHHRKPKVLGGSGKLGSPNMIRVSVPKHRAWHLLVETSTPEEIAEIINKTWLDPDWKLIAVRRTQCKNHTTTTSEGGMEK